MTDQDTSPTGVQALTRTTYGLREAAVMLGFGYTAAREKVQRGDFPVPTFRNGRRVLVPAAPLHRLLGIAEPEPASTASTKPVRPARAR